jgi:hypothetical protein
LNAGLSNRATARLLSKIPGDDGNGSLAATSSYIDDTCAFLDYSDLPWFLQTFSSLGQPLGIKLNRSKTKILTVTGTGTSAEVLSASQKSLLDQALSLLDGPSSESTEGTRFLGAPLGSPAFAKAFLAKSASAFAKRTRRLTTRLESKQTIAMLYKLCALPSLSHLLPADVLLNTNFDEEPSLTAWHSPLSKTIHESTGFLLQHLTGAKYQLSPLAWILAHHPVRKGGLGLRDHSEASITAFMVPLLYAHSAMPPVALTTFATPRRKTHCDSGQSTLALSLRGPLHQARAL